jgi:large subunit ribosomal protein L15
MVVRRARKQRRGERSYHGSHKKWRGHGSRGGRGNANLKKHKWSWTLNNDPDHFGKHGFKPRNYENIKTINLKELDQIADRLVNQKLAEMDGKKIKIDLEKIGYNKLLGSGKVTKPLIIQAKYFSKKAIAKLEEADGQAIIKDNQTKN